jgi:hypothetical protein
MSRINQTADEARSSIRAGLSLQLDEGPQPFALVGDEAKFTPEDWAWLFLRMNSEYQKAHAARILEDAGSRINQEINKLDDDEVKEDHDGSCASRFGLAAWLPPSTEKLPKLSHERDSWFFPLTRPVAEDYRRQEVSEKKYVRTSPVFARQLDKYMHIVANERTFGYRRPIIPAPAKQSPGSTLGITWVAIDCSIPPDAQILGLRALATVNREALIQSGWKTHDTADQVSVEEVTHNDVFQHMRFKKSSGAIVPSGYVDEFWRAAQIDVLGPIVTQIGILLKELRQVHEALVAKGRAHPPPFRRFKNSLPSVKDSDGQFRNGGSYLKALHVIAELTEWGHDATMIARLTDIPPEKERNLHSWRHPFHEDLEEYIEESREMIAGGYKMLIHAQRPNQATYD